MHEADEPKHRLSTQTARPGGGGRGIVCIGTDEGDGGFDDGARRVIEIAELEARASGHSRIRTEHLLLGLLTYKQGRARESLSACGVIFKDAWFEVVGTKIRNTVPVFTNEWTPRTVRVLEIAKQISSKDGAPARTEHLLLALTQQKGPARAVLDKLGVNIEWLKELTEAVVKNPEKYRSRQDYSAFKLDYRKDT